MSFLLCWQSFISFIGTECASHVGKGLGLRVDPYLLAYEPLFTVFPHYHFEENHCPPSCGALSTSAKNKHCYIEHIKHWLFPHFQDFNSDYVRAQRLYEKLGFVHEGRLKNHIEVERQLKDLVFLSLFLE